MEKKSARILCQAAGVLSTAEYNPLLLETVQTVDNSGDLANLCRLVLTGMD